MSWNNPYLEAVGVPSWVPRESTVGDLIPESRDVTKESKANLSNEKAAPILVTAETCLKALVSNPKSKFAIVVSSNSEKIQLQKSWKYLKFAWKQWQNNEFPASLYQVDAQSDYSLEQLQKKNLLIVDTCHLEGASNKTESSEQKSDNSQSLNSVLINAPALNQLGSHKKSWWSFLQTIEQKIQLL